MRSDTHSTRPARRKQRGFTMIETLVALSVLSVAALSLAHSMITAIRTARRVERNTIAMQLATRKLEELAAITPTSLNDTYDLTENNLVVNRVRFTRVTNVTVNADQSRTVDVTVSPLSSQYGAPVSYRSTFALWGSN